MVYPQVSILTGPPQSPLEERASLFTQVLLAERVFCCWAKKMIHPFRIKAKRLESQRCGCLIPGHAEGRREWLPWGRGWPEEIAKTGAPHSPCRFSGRAPPFS